MKSYPNKTDPLYVCCFVISWISEGKNNELNIYYCFSPGAFGPRTADILGRLALFGQKLWEKEGIFILIPLTCPLELYSKEAFNVEGCIKYSFAYIASDTS
jgi:hypothetical protein